MFEKKPVDYDVDILPACLPSEDDTFEGERCTLVGWGFTFSSNASIKIEFKLHSILLVLLKRWKCSANIKRSKVGRDDRI